MRRRREVEHRLQAFREIRGVMAGMKSLALLETHKLALLALQHERVVEGIERAAGDFLRFYPPPVIAPAVEVLLVIGSERGFCGDFNAKLLQAFEAWREQRKSAKLLLVGHKLAARITWPEEARLDVEGPTATEEVDVVLLRLLDVLNDIAAGGALRLDAIHHRADRHEVAIRTVLPAFEGLAPPPLPGYPPRLHLAPTEIYTGLVDQYLYALLEALFRGSLMAENRQRVQHLEGAIERLDGRVEELERRRRALRQEEITEEIEVILLGRDALSPK